MRAGFPDRRLPHTNLCRWYDLRVEQVRQRHEQIALAAQMLGDRLTEGGFTNLYAAIKNALGVMVFSLMDECPDQNLVREELYRLAKVVIALGRLERAEERAEREKETIGNRAPATERQETTRYQRAADRPRSSAAPAAGAPPYAGENPRPPASAREERATVERPAAIGRKEPDPAAVLRELGPDIEKLADTLISMVPAGAFVSNRART